jgi:DGQHR domain-containing protein
MSDMTMPAIAYKQGNRQMYMIVDDARALTQTFVAERKDLDPRQKKDSDQVGNRRLDKAHKKGISEYLESEDEYVIGAAVLYTPPGSVYFQPESDRWKVRNVQLGTLSIPIGTKFHIGDGQHRLGAYAEVLAEHDDPDDDIFQKIVNSGQPAILVEEERGWKIALDFVDLGHNAKPLTTSLGFALEQRQEINRLAFELAMELDLFTYKTPEGSLEKAGRIEFQGNAVGKGSAKLYTFASWRFAVATYLLGWDTRDKRKILRETKALLEPSAQYDRVRGEMRDVFIDASHALPGWQQLQRDPKSYSARKFRETSVLGTSAGLTALTYALRVAGDHGIPVGEAIARLAPINWAKEKVDAKAPFFNHTIVVGGKVLSSRTNYEPAGDDLARVVLGDDPAAVMKDRHEAFAAEVEQQKADLEAMAVS